MLKRSLIVVMLAVLLGSSLVSAADQAESAPGIRLLHATTSSAVLDLVTSRYSLTADSSSSDITQRLTLPGAGTSADAGKPQLPMFSALLSVPANARIELHVRETGSQALPGRYTIAATPRPAPLTDDLQPGATIATPDAPTYASSALYPAAPARIAEDGWLRNQRIVRIELSPFQYRPALGRLIWHRHLQVEVRWNASAATQQRTPIDALDAQLGGTVLNRQAALSWQTTLQPSRQEPQLRAQTTAPRYKIVIDHDGIYRLSHADLEAAGLDLASTDPRSFRLSSQGRNVAIQMIGEADGRFDPGDALIFYGQKFSADVVSDTVVLDGSVVTTDTIMSESYAPASSYTDDNVYWLDTGGTPGPRMASVDGTPGNAPTPAFYRETIRAERSNVWWTWHFTSRDIWFWDRVQTSDQTTRAYTTTLDALATTPISATVRGEVVARNQNISAAPDHRTRFVLNDTLLEDATWDGLVRHRFEAEIPQSALREGENRLDFTVINQPALGGDDLFFDWFEIDYARRFQATQDQLTFTGDAGEWRYRIDGFTQPGAQIYDITAPTTPRLIANPASEAVADTYRLAFQRSHAAGARFIAVAAPGMQRPKAISRYVGPDLTRESADYIVITHHTLRTASERLAAYRAAQGLRTLVVDVDDLYNQFNHGIYHPVAIKRFLAHAYAHWQKPAPGYVVLAGDGHWNFKNHNPQRYGGPPILMPPNMAWIDPWQGEVDSTNMLAAIAGTDLLPDLAIGRLPANSNAELNAMIDKIVGYEQAAPGDWQQRLLFVADNTPDAAGDFVASSETLIAEHTPADAQIERLYLEDYCGPPAAVPSACPEATDRLVDTLNLTGTLLLSYIGHASIGRWTHEQLLVNADIARLDNGSHLPIVLSMTCLDGYWFYPNQPGLAEDLARTPTNGAIATFSPTGLGVATSHDVLERGFYDALFRRHVRTLGPATIAAKQALYATGQDSDLINTFVLFGDPALRLPLPSFDVYAPVAMGG
ncbi:MAG TPA: C25 family cysteine peptidase [Herpetosiphonaceae bacterium]